MKKLGMWSFLAVLLWPLATTAAMQDVEVVTTGVGASHNEALADALAKAVTQVNGGHVSMATGGLRVRDQESNRGGEAGNSDRQRELVLDRTTDLQSSGQVRRYEVLSEQRLDDGNQMVKVRAVVVSTQQQVYEAKTGTGDRNRVAVFPVLHDRSSLSTRTRDVPLARVADDLTRAIESDLLQTNSFQLLDRRSLNASLAELGLLESSLASPQEQAKLNSLRGADFVIASKLFTEGGEVRHNPVTGQRLQAPTELVYEYRVLVPATSELVLTRQIRVEPSKDEQAGRWLASAFAREISRELDMRLNKTTRLPRLDPAQQPDTAPPQPEGPRNNTGVRLPFD